MYGPYISRWRRVKCHADISACDNQGVKLKGKVKIPSEHSYCKNINVCHKSAMLLYYISMFLFNYITSYTYIYICYFFLKKLEKTYY